MKVVSAKGTICNEHTCRSLPGAAGGLGGAVSPQWVQGRALVGVQVAKPLEALAILQYKVSKKCPQEPTFLVHFYLCAAYRLKGKIHLN